MQLFPYQQEGAAWLAKQKRALLADEMGLGKTAQAIRACDLVNARKVVVVCPASLRANWQREFDRFSLTGVEPIVFSYDKAARGALAEEFGIDVLICDEAHYLKERSSQRTVAIFGPNCDGAGVVERASFVWLLTGTPVPNSPYELWPMLRACAPGVINGKNEKPMSFWSFTERYCITVESRFGTKIAGGKNLIELRDRIAPFVMRRKKLDVLKDLPPLIVDTIALSPENIKKRLKEINEHPLAAQVRVALEADGLSGLENVAPHVASLRKLIGELKAPIVGDYVRERLRDTDDKIVVFAHHSSVIGYLRNALSDYGVAFIVGATPANERQHMVEKFQGDKNCRVFIGSIMAAGTGLTLTAASDLIFAEASWVPAENEQAMMRIHRIGQGQPCLVRFTALAGSLDESIMRVVARKASQVAQIFG